MSKIYTLYQVEGKSGLIDVCYKCYDAFFTDQAPIKTETTKRPPLSCDDCKKSFAIN